jgi:signal transduction histidine kinase
MLLMIWNMLDVYKKDSGALVPVQEVVNFNVLLRNCLSEYSFVIKEKNIAIIYDFADGLPEVHTDRILLRRVLANLIDNAVKFTPKDGQIRVQAVCNDNQFVISVINSGAGLSDVQLEKIFQRFWQTESGRKYGIGSGMGLFVSKQIIESLGGNIVCTSTKHGCTSFIVTLKLR